MRVLGIDPGSRRTGLGIVETADDGGDLRLVAWECIRTTDAEVSVRLGEIYTGVRCVMDAHQPSEAAVEQVFVAHNARSALVLGQAAGSAICAAVTGGLAVAQYSARQIKNAVVGSGGANKSQVQHMVRVLLGLRATPGEDEADALACAICHIHTRQVQEKMRRAV